MVAVISGLTDVDAITLSTGRLIGNDTLQASTGWRVILVAALANLVFKGGIVAVVGRGAAFKKIIFWYGLALVAGLLILFLWPGSSADSGSAGDLQVLAF